MQRRMVTYHPQWCPLALDRKFGGSVVKDTNGKQSSTVEHSSIQDALCVD